MNALIGNGNWLASRWYNAGREGDEAPDLHIQNMSCRANREGHHCTFTLSRDGGVSVVVNEVTPDQLICTAQFVRSDDANKWTVKHRPPRGAGHSRTDMRCKASR